MKNALLYYSVGPLLYCPANHTGVADSLIQERFGTGYSLALCLEDTIHDDHVAEAEAQLIDTFHMLYDALSKNPSDFYLPGIYIRIRTPEQIKTLTQRLGDCRCLLHGFILPKFHLESADSYIAAFLECKNCYTHPIYLLPILESPDLIHLQKRHTFLYQIKEKLAPFEQDILNIRVGGNDLCHLFGFRRHSDESIHHIPAISNIFSDIITVFSTDYIVSGPVWEYYNGVNWKEGLTAELKEDILCGFVGKTVIHPNQIPVVQRAYQVSRTDYLDAQSILNWDASNPSFVSGSIGNERMNEHKTHINWAKKILFLAEAYGIRE